MRGDFTKALYKVPKHIWMLLGGAAAAAAAVAAAAASLSVT